MNDSPEKSDQPTSEPQSLNETFDKSDQCQPLNATFDKSDESFSRKEEPYATPKIIANNGEKSIRQDQDNVARPDHEVSDDKKARQLDRTFCVKESSSPVRKIARISPLDRCLDSKCNAEKGTEVYILSGCWDSNWQYTLVLL